MTSLSFRTGTKPRGKYMGMLAFAGEPLASATPMCPYFFHFFIREARSMFKGVTGQKVKVFAFDKTTNSPKTGDAINISAYIAKDNGAVTQLTDTSATEADSTNAPGEYTFDITQTECTADEIVVTGRSATTNIVVIGMPAVIYTVPPNFTKQIIDTNGRLDISAVGGTAQTAADLGVLPARLTSTRASYLDNLSAGAVALASLQGQAATAAVLQMLYNTAGEIYVALAKLSGGFAGGGDWTPATGDVKISLDGGASANITTLPTAISMGNTSIWKFPLAQSELAAKRITIAVGDNPSGKVVQDQVVNILTYGHPSSGLPWLGAVQTGVAVSASVNTIRISEDGIDPTSLSLVVTSTTGGVGSTPTLEDRVADSFNTSTKDVSVVPDFALTPTGIIGWAAYAFGGKIVTDYATQDSQNTQTAALSDLSNRVPPALVDNMMVASVGEVQTSAITGDAVDTTAVTKITASLPTATQNADALLDRTDGIETGITLRQATRIMLSADGGVVSGMEGTNPIFMDANNTTVRINATTDAFGNRTAVVLTPG